jgi:hypothetical protein
VSATTSTVVFRNTRSWSDFRETPAPVALKGGVSTVAFANSGACEAGIHEVPVASLTG